VSYPSGAFGGYLKDLAALIKANIGVRVAATDFGGWVKIRSCTDDICIATQ
jgi:hypothetical protein